jgi:hypothetical protein
MWLDSLDPATQPRPLRAIGVIRPTIDPDGYATMPIFEAACRLCDTVSLPGTLAEIETWLNAHLRSKHSREVTERRPVRSGLEDWPGELKR